MQFLFPNPPNDFIIIMTGDSVDEESECESIENYNVNDNLNLKFTPG